MVAKIYSLINYCSAKITALYTVDICQSRRISEHAIGHNLRALIICEPAIGCKILVETEFNV